MNITTIGIDLAKTVFQVHGVDERGKAALRRTLKRSEVVRFFANLPPCLIGMEACASAHFWARRLSQLGHTVKLMAPQFVKPYVKTNKNDARDAEAICEAVSRPTMRFVPVKTIEQQALLGLHRARQGFVFARTAQANQIRGLLAEFGVVMPKGIRYLEQHMPEILETADNGLPDSRRELFSRLFNHFRELDRQVRELETSDHSLAPRRCSQPAPGSNPWDRPAHGECVGSEYWRCEDVQERSPIRRVAGPCTASRVLRWQDHLAGHQQARRYVPQNTTDSRRARCTAAAETPCRSRTRMARAVARSAQPQYRRGRSGQQECPDSLGTSCARPRLSSEVHAER